MTKSKVDFVKKHILSYVYYRLKDTGITYKQVSDVLTRYQGLLAKDIENGKLVVFREGLGSLQLSKIKRTIEVDEDGNIINNMPIDINRTMKFWKEHPEHKNKKYIRFINEHSDGYLFSLDYRFKRSSFRLRSFYTFKKNSTMTSNLSKNIKEGKVDAIIKDY